MKTFAKTTVTSLFILFFCSTTSAQQCPCDKILENGLYRYINIAQASSFSKDFRSYLLTERFELDLKSGKWGGSITVPVKGVPVSAGATSSNEEIKTFQQKVASEESLSIKASDFQTIVSSIPDKELASIYSDCLAKNCNDRSGFRVDTEVGEDLVVFTIYYRKSFDSDPMPKVKSIDVRNATNVTTALKVNDAIQNSNLISCNRDLKKDLILVLDTDRGSVVYKIPSESEPEIAKDMPVGTIIASYLNPEQFDSATKNNEKSPSGWASGRSKWSPADGREVPNSLFQKITSQVRVPDLRGMFLRGLNYSEPNRMRQDQFADPEPNRQVGSSQMDAFQGHGHKHEIGASSENPRGTFKGVDGSSQHQGGRVQEPASIGSYGEPRFSTETRPNNVAVFYYIRIN